MPDQEAIDALAEIIPFGNVPSFYPTGTRFRTRGKAPRECTVVDIWKTYNTAGELVRVRYVATFQLAGQTVTDWDVVRTTIALGLIE